VRWNAAARSSGLVSVTVVNEPGHRARVLAGCNDRQNRVQYIDIGRTFERSLVPAVSPSLEPR